MAKPALSTIYKGSFKDRPRFDGGGYVDYSGGDLSPIDTSYADQYRVPDYTDLSPIDTSQAQNTAANNRLEAQHNINAIDAAPTAQPSQGALGKILAGMGLGGGDTSNAAALGAAVKLLSAYGQYQTNKNGQKLPALPAMPPMGALPTLPGSSSTGYGPPGGYNFQNYQGAGQKQSPAQPAPSYFTYGQGPEQQFFQQVKPGGGPIAPVTGMATGGAVKGFDVGGLVPGGQTAGSMQQIMNQGVLAQPGQTPMTPRPMSGMPGQQPGQQVQQGPPPQAPPQAQIGLQQRPPSPPPPQMPPSTMMQRMQPPQRPQMPGGMQRPMGRQQFATGGDVPQQGALSAVGQSRHITGPGDGTSDSIPARLANGEYVIDAQAVSMLGNGDNGAGAKKLDEFRKSLRQHKGGALSKGQMAPDAKPIHKYMGGK